MQLKKWVSGFVLVLIIFVGIFYWQREKLISSREVCKAIGIQKYHQNIFTWDENGEKKNIKGIKKYPSIRDAKFYEEENFVLFWFINKSEEYKDGALLMDDYTLKNQTAEFNGRLRTDTPSGLARDEFVVRPRGKFFVIEMVGRSEIIPSGFYYLNNEQKLESLAGSNQMIEASKNLKFILNHGGFVKGHGYSKQQSGLFINNTNIHKALKKRGLNWENFKRKDFWNPGVKWWDGSFWYLLDDNSLVKVTPEMTSNETEVAHHYIPEKSLNNYPESVQSLAKKWKKKLNIEIEHIKSSDVGLPSFGDDGHKLLLRRSLNKLYVIVKLTPRDSTREVPVELYEVHEDGKTSKVSQNRKIKINGLKDGNRRLSCEVKQYVEFWGVKWELPDWLHDT